MAFEIKKIGGHLISDETNELYEELESIEIIEKKHYIADGTKNAYSGWSIVFFPVIEGQVYEYSGLTQLGNSPHFAFENEYGKIIEVFRQSIGKNVITAPPNATRLGASIKDCDLEVFKFKQVKYSTLEAQNLIKENISKINKTLGDFNNILEQGTLTSEGIEKNGDLRRVRFAEAITNPFYLKTNDGFIIRIVCFYDKETLSLVSYTTYTTKTEFFSDGKYAVRLVFGKENIEENLDISENIIQSVDKSIISLFDSQSEIAFCNINELPEASKRRIAIVETDNRGPVWSDSYVWRWVNNNKLAVSAKSYYTAKVSDATEITSYNKTDIYDCYSITKLLAALVGTRYISDYNESITVIEFDNNSVGMSDTWVKPNDIITYDELYHAILIKSDNAAARTLARCLGYKINSDAQNDSEAYNSFCGKMEEVAQEIGMKNTSNFTESWTYMKTTSEDLVKLLIYVQKNSSIITDIWGKAEHDVSITGVNERIYHIESTTNSVARQVIPEFIGGKTGSGSATGAYAFIWLNPNDNEIYATALLEANIVYNGGVSPRWTDSRNIIDEVQIKMIDSTYKDFSNVNYYTKEEVQNYIEETILGGAW